MSKCGLPLCLATVTQYVDVLMAPLVVVQITCLVDGNEDPVPTPSQHSKHLSCLFDPASPLRSNPALILLMQWLPLEP